MNDEEIKQLIASNAKAIEALTNDIAQLKNEWQRAPRSGSLRDRTQLSQALENMAMGMTAMQLEFINMQRRIDDNTADIRELAV